MPRCVRSSDLTSLHGLTCRAARVEDRCVRSLLSCNPRSEGGEHPMAQRELPSQDSFASRRSPSPSFDLLDRLATGLYTLASMLVGEGEDSARLVEAVIANAEVFSGSDLGQTTKKGQLELCKAAIGL